MTKLSDLPARVHEGRNYPFRSKKIHNDDSNSDDETSVTSLEPETVPKLPPLGTYVRPTQEQIRSKAEAREQVRTLVPIRVKDIQLVRKSREQVGIVNCSYLIPIVRELLKRPSIYNPLYEELFEGLQTARFEAIMRLRVVASGVDPRRKEELDTFIKVKMSEHEFVLPISFLKNCREAFLKFPH